MTRTVVVTGITGQDGTFLAKQLLAKGYDVIGIYRRTSTDNKQRLRQFRLLESPQLKLIEGELTDTFSVYSILNQFKPDEIYNTGAQSHVNSSFSQPNFTMSVNYDGVLNILEWLRQNKSTKLYQCGTSEQFGNSVSVINEFSKRVETTFDKLKPEDFKNPHWQIFQDERTPFNPQSPYAISKLAAHHLCMLYRDSYGVQVWPCVFYNHDSELRGSEFVTRKITLWLGEFKKWLDDTPFLKIKFDENNIYKNGGAFPKLRLGNIESCRDFGYAGEYTQLMQDILSKTEPDFYVVATGQTVSVKDFLYKCFVHTKIPENLWDQLYVIDKSLYRPSEVPYLKGNSIKVQKALNWAPKYKVDDIVKIMLLQDCP